jgi:hypothetical protein
MTMKTAVVILTWKRLNLLNYTLIQLMKQTHKDFDVFISNADLSPGGIRSVNRTSDHYKKRGLRSTVMHDGNDMYAFRRFTLGKYLYESGYEVILFIDDDIKFSNRYVEMSLSQYEPRTYKSGFTWIFYNQGRDYYKFRKRVFDNRNEIHYAGTGISMMDASIFADRRIIDEAPDAAIKIEDLWLSYIVFHKPGWRIKYMETKGVTIGGGDQFALYKNVQKDEINKKEFLRILVNMGWNLPKDPPAITTA